MTTDPEPPETEATTRTEPSAEPALGSGTWVILPTYNEADNLPGISAAILEALPGATLLVVDDGSPDGTGQLADGLAARRPAGARQAPGRRSRASAAPTSTGSARRSRGGATTIVQMDADWSHDPKALPRLIGPIDGAAADLVIGSRYTAGGGVEDWGIVRKIISRGGSTFARIVLGLKPHDLTGGFKAWRAATLALVPFDGVRAGGYVFQIEMTYRASRLGARVVEVPITFRDRRVGQSKMSRRIVVEALVVVVSLRWDELRGRGPVPRAR